MPTFSTGWRRSFKLDKVLSFKLSEAIFIKKKEEADLNPLPLSNWHGRLNICHRQANYTQPVGLGRPAILQAPLPGPDGNSS